MFIGNANIFGRRTDGSIVYLLDTYSAAAAYSLRQLKTGVTNVVRVRRTSDNAEQDFTATEVTDGTLATFCSATNGYVVKWYDQVGSNDATEATASHQLEIVSSGVVHLENSQPTLKSGTTKRPLSTTSDITVQTAFIVARAESTVANNINYMIGNDSPSSGIFWGGTLAGVDGLGAFDGTNVNDITGEDFNQHLGYFNMRSSKLYVAKDGGSENDTGTFASSLTVNLIGGRDVASTVYMRGNIQEVILFNSDESSNKSAIETDINTHYSIY